MPELPEVETIRRGIAPHIIDQTITGVVVRERRLRWPITGSLEELLNERMIQAVVRRGKYIALCTGAHSVLIHLGMSGRLRIVPANAPVAKHDHVDIHFANGYCLRFTDPRRFGALLWWLGPIEEHPLLRALGPEPFAEEFTGGYLHALARNRKGPVKSFLMDSRVVAGVGNIYANEALYVAGVHPLRAVNRISLNRFDQLASAIRTVLAEALAQGGTTLRDFVNGEGQPGYFKQHLKVYGRNGLPCARCDSLLKCRRLNQRATYYCINCQR